MIDGATRLQTLWRIVVPLALPGLVVALVFSFAIRVLWDTHHTYRFGEAPTRTLTLLDDAICEKQISIGVNAVVHRSSKQGMVSVQEKDQIHKSFQH